jgi:hypothetical protein
MLFVLGEPLQLRVGLGAALQPPLRFLQPPLRVMQLGGAISRRGTRYRGRWRRLGRWLRAPACWLLWGWRLGCWLGQQPTLLWRELRGRGRRGRPAIKEAHPTARPPACPPACVTVQSVQLPSSATRLHIFFVFGIGRACSYGVWWPRSN